MGMYICVCVCVCAHACEREYEYENESQLRVSHKKLCIGIYISYLLTRIYVISRKKIREENSTFECGIYNSSFPCFTLNNFSKVAWLSLLESSEIRLQDVLSAS